MLRHGMEPVWRAGRGSYLARGGRGARRSVLCPFGAATNRGRVGDRGRGGVRRVELLLYGSSPGALCKRLSRCGGRATVGNASPLPDGGLCNSASVGLGPYSQADRLRLRYTFGNFGAVIDPGLAQQILIHGRGAARAEDAQGTPTQSHMSPSILVYEDKIPRHVSRCCLLARKRKNPSG